MEKIEDIWLCSLCVKDLSAWEKEDFDFEEEDRDANTVGTVKGKSKSATIHNQPRTIISNFIIHQDKKNPAPFPQMSLYLQ